MRGSTAMGSENRSSRDDGDAGNRGEVASGERHGAGNATIGPTVGARSLAEGTRLAVMRGPSAMIGAAGRSALTFGIRRHMTRQPNLAAEPAVYSPVASVIRSVRGPVRGRTVLLHLSDATVGILTSHQGDTAPVPVPPCFALAVVGMVGRLPGVCRRRHSWVSLLRGS